MLGSLGLLVASIVTLASIGTCASGGPYVSARPCPAGTEYWILAIFGAVVIFLARLWVLSPRGGRGGGAAGARLDPGRDDAGLGVDGRRQQGRDVRLHERRAEAARGRAGGDGH